MLSFISTFNKDQRRGIFALFIVIAILQGVYFLLSSFDFSASNQNSVEEKEWLALQSQIDALKEKAGKKQYKVYPFNPNFISDYKGYTLGLNIQQINRLHKFRAAGKYVNSAQEFKMVTGVSDSLLSAISPLFKFPEWVTKKQQQSISFTNKQHTASYKNNKAFIKEAIVQQDINEALEEDLVKVYGIGPGYAKAILRTRASLGSFVSMDQMGYFTSFSPEAIAGLNKYFKVESKPQVNKINVNTASLKQLSYFTYFNKDIARSIITQRSMKGKIKNIDEMTQISNFPVDKVNIIALYLEF